MDVESKAKAKRLSEELRRLREEMLQISVQANERLRAAEELLMMLSEAEYISQVQRKTPRDFSSEFRQSGA